MLVATFGSCCYSYEDTYYKGFCYSATAPATASPTASTTSTASPPRSTSTRATTMNILPTTSCSYYRVLGLCFRSKTFASGSLNCPGSVNYGNYSDTSGSVCCQSTQYFYDYDRYCYWVYVGGASTTSPPSCTYKCSASATRTGTPTDHACTMVAVSTAMLITTGIAITMTVQRLQAALTKWMASATTLVLPGERALKVDAALLMKPTMTATVTIMMQQDKFPVQTHTRTSWTVHPTRAEHTLAIVMLLLVVLHVVRIGGWIIITIIVMTSTLTSNNITIVSSDVMNNY